MNGLLSPQTLSRLDRFGVCLALACAIQCLAMPVLVTVFPLAGLSFFLEEPLEVFFVGASIALATGSLCWGFRVHRHRSILVILAGAVGMIMTGQWLTAEPYELALVVTGAVLLAGGHLLNGYLCRHCAHCQDGGRHGVF